MNTDKHPAPSPELERAIEPWLRHMTWRRNFAEWRERRINQEYYQQERLNLLKRITGPLASIRLLDLGAGMGGFAVAAAREGAHVTACEYNHAYCTIIALRAARHGLTIPICNAAGEHLPLPANSVDAVISWDVIEHVQSPTQMLAEIARVLRPGGCVLLTVINRYAWNDPHYHMRGINWLPRAFAEVLIALRGRSKAGAAFRDMQRLSDMHYFTYDGFVALAHRTGFTVTDVREELLLDGTLASPRRSRQIIRRILRQTGLEHAAYIVQRQWSMGMFELMLCKGGREENASAR